MGQYVANCAKELGGDIKVVEFVRFEKGEGLESARMTLPLKLPA